MSIQKKRFAYFGLLFSLLLSCLQVSAAMRVSLLTTTPTPSQVYTMWGHSAIRVQSEDFDRVFNYGVFSFGEGFIYRFVKGETDYWLARESAASAIRDAERKGAFMFEQVLNLSEEEAQHLYQALMENALPENRVYRYNFFFDNCATRPYYLIEKTLGGLDRPVFNNTKTYRDLTRDLTGWYQPWLSFGIDLCLGSKADEVVTDEGLLFLPMELRRSFEETRRKDGTPLVKEEIMVCSVPETTEDHPVNSPLIVSLALLAFVVLWGAFRIWKKKKSNLYFIPDSIIFTLFGLVGILVFFLTFFSEHPCVTPNYNILWTNPMQLLVPVLSHTRVRHTQFYKGLVLLLLLMSLVVALGGWMLPQDFNFPTIIFSFVMSLCCLFQLQRVDFLKKMQMTKKSCSKS
jgi:hypothetical protein